MATRKDHVSVFVEETTKYSALVRELGNFPLDPIVVDSLLQLVKGIDDLLTSSCCSEDEDKEYTTTATLVPGNKENKLPKDLTTPIILGNAKFQFIGNPNPL